MTETSGFRVAADHPALAGHFPGRPIVPGVMVLEAAIEQVERLLGVRVVAVPTAKFSSILQPDVDSALTMSRRADGRVNVRCTVGDRVVMTVLLETVDPSAAAQRLAGHRD